MRMERVNLSQMEKIAFRTVASGNVNDDFLDSFSGALDSLSQKGFVKLARVEGGKAIDAYLTSIGRLYIDENPRLRNKVNWSAITAILTALGIFASLVFHSCMYSKLL